MLAAALSVSKSLSSVKYGYGGSFRLWYHPYSAAIWYTLTRVTEQEFDQNWGWNTCGRTTVLEFVRRDVNATRVNSGIKYTSSDHSEDLSVSAKGSLDSLWPSSQVICRLSARVDGT